MKRAYTHKKKPLRRFLAYDGEGIGNKYILLANSQTSLWAKRGLTTAQCLEFLTRIESGNPIRVFFSFSYDVAHIVHNLSNPKLVALYNGEEVTWKGYTLWYLPRKILQIRRKGVQYTYYDVWSFFGSSFLGAVEKFLHRKDELIEEGKKARADFSKWERVKIEAYNKRECELLEEIMSQLRETLDQPCGKLKNLIPRGWYGAGAIAAKILRSLDVGLHVHPETLYPERLVNIFNHAYFGGHVENFYVGTTYEKVYRYDIRSAYPAAMLHVPRLSFRWERTKTFLPDKPFSVYKVKWDMSKDFHLHTSPAPLAWRDKNGGISFRSDGEAWHWQPELKIALENYPHIEVLDGYVMEETGIYPLRDPIHYLYNRRADLRNREDPREYPLKLSLNSLYGKFAQREGSQRYRSIAWAGYITALCRATVLNAILLDPSAILAVMTDGILSLRPLKLVTGASLGAWECTEYQGCSILASGVYKLGVTTSGESITRYRGFSVSDFPMERLLTDCSNHGEAIVKSRMFINHLLAIKAKNVYGTRRLEVTEIERRIRPFAGHKRHFDAPAYNDPIERLDLTRHLYGSRMIFAPEGVVVPPSAPYGNYKMSELQKIMQDAYRELNSPD